MPITSKTIRLAGDLRVQIDDHVDRATRDLVRAYAQAWQQLTRDWDAARDEIAQVYARGDRPTYTQLLRLRRVNIALAATRDLLDDLGRRSGIRLLQDLDGLIREVADAQVPIMTSQLPAGAAATELVGSLERVDRRQLAWILERSTKRITSKALKFGPAGMKVLRSELVRATALGLNPRTAAQTIMAQGNFLASMRHGFNATLNDAMILARTEMLDATRAAAKEAHQANAKVCEGWMWLAQLDTRTCPSCWGMHGSIHDLDEDGPDDHQQGRCSRMPTVKPWKDLGLDIPEPPSLVPNAQETFANLPKADQLRIMGPARLEALNAGEIGWDQLSMLRHTTGWRRSFAPAPVRAIRRTSRRAS